LFSQIIAVKYLFNIFQDWCKSCYNSCKIKIFVSGLTFAVNVNLKLSNKNTHPVLTRWIKAFLTNRQQCVKVDCHESSWKTANGGLPQGTCLGPLLFAILVNPLLKDWNGRLKFVHDTTALEVVPRCSPSLLPLLVQEISTNSHPLVEWSSTPQNAKK
jgi:hypothetical protein